MFSRKLFLYVIICYIYIYIYYIYYCYGPIWRRCYNNEGETIDGEIMLKAMIEKFWGDLFCINGDATHGSKKEIVDGVWRREKDLSMRRS